MPSVRIDCTHYVRENNNYCYLIFNVYHGPTRPMNFSIVWVNCENSYCNTKNSC